MNATVRKPGLARMLALATLFETNRGRRVPLPPRLMRKYGELRLPPPGAQPYVYSNFVTTLDGVVSLNVKGHASGADISGFNVQDCMVMGLLRSVADAIVIGSGTLSADRWHVWTAAGIFPAFANEYRRLRAALGRPEVPLNLIVSGSGDIDLRLPVFTLAPQIVGRETGDHRLSLVMGKLFAPGDTKWGRLVDARRGSSHLFLRYSFAGVSAK